MKIGVTRLWRGQEVEGKSVEGGIRRGGETDGARTPSSSGPVASDHLPVSCTTMRTTYMLPIATQLSLNHNVP